MTLDQIELAVRAYKGNCSTLFRRHGAGWHCILYPHYIMTEAEYARLRARLDAPVAITAQDRLRNKMHAKASRHEGHS
jgi:hypothetical protein